MNKTNKILNITFSTIITLVILLLVFNKYELNFNIRSSYDLGLIIGFFAQFLTLGFVVYQFIKGLLLSDRKTILRNIVVLLLMNFILL